MTRYVALLRGINVGGNNIIKMAELKACFETLGFAKVRTYIQSGNVLFESAVTDQAKLVSKIENCLSDKFGYKSRLVVCSEDQLREVVTGAPRGFGGKPDEYRYDVIFLRPPLSAAQALQGISTKEGVDQAFQGTDVLYFSRLISRITSSRINKIVGTPIYQNMTIRNWNTTTKLLALLEKE